jgi:hypothetical protein
MPASMWLDGARWLLLIVMTTRAGWSEQYDSRPSCSSGSHWRAPAGAQARQSNVTSARWSHCPRFGRPRCRHVVEVADGERLRHLLDNALKHLNDLPADNVHSLATLIRR